MPQSLPVPTGIPLDPTWRMSVVECLRRYPLEQAIKAMEQHRAALARACPPGMLPLAEAASRLGVNAQQLAGFLSSRPALRKKCRLVDGRLFVPEQKLAGMRVAARAFRLTSVPSLGRRRPD